MNLKQGMLARGGSGFPKICSERGQITPICRYHGNMIRNAMHFPINRYYQNRKWNALLRSLSCIIGQITYLQCKPLHAMWHN